MIDDLIRELRQSYTRDGVVEWLNRTRAALNGRTPLQAIVDGDKHLVLALIDQGMTAT